MRPRTLIRGNLEVGGRWRGAHDASMRPRTLIRGNARLSRWEDHPAEASMRPRTLIRGSGYDGAGRLGLLYGFNEAADSHPRKPYKWSDGKPKDTASMRPRTLIRGNAMTEAGVAAKKAASMRPRTLIRGNGGGRLRGDPGKAASMRPRTLIRGNDHMLIIKSSADTGFNEAADSHPRKRPAWKSLQDRRLQTDPRAPPLAGIRKLSITATQTHITRCLSKSSSNDGVSSITPSLAE